MEKFAFSILFDTYPFVDDVTGNEMSGAQMRRALEQSLTLERGLLQVSGLNMTYDLRRPEQQRIVSLERNGKTIVANGLFAVAAPAYLAEGGDLYNSFAESAAPRSVGKVSQKP